MDESDRERARRRMIEEQIGMWTDEVERLRLKYVSDSRVLRSKLRQILDGDQVYDIQETIDGVPENWE